MRLRREGYFPPFDSVEMRVNKTKQPPSHPHTPTYASVYVCHATSPKTPIHHQTKGLWNASSTFGALRWWPCLFCCEEGICEVTLRIEKRHIRIHIAPQESKQHEISSTRLQILHSCPMLYFDRNIVGRGAPYPCVGRALCVCGVSEWDLHRRFSVCRAEGVHVFSVS